MTLVGKHRRQTFLVVGHQVYTHLRSDFGPLLVADPLQILKVAFSLGGNAVQAQYSTLHGPIHSPLDAMESSCTLGRETTPNYNVSTPMLDGGDGVLEVIFSILPPPNAASRVARKSTRR